MFEITGVRRGKGSDTLELTAIEPVVGSKQFLIQRGLGLLECPYEFPKGSKLKIDLPSPNKFEVGDRVEVQTVLEQPSVQDMITRKWRSYL